MAIAIFAAKTASKVRLNIEHGQASPPRAGIPFRSKKHCRRARSLFALGLHTLRKIFVTASPAQAIAFLDQLLSPKLPIKPLLSLGFM
jgi:hypothetical protein